MYCTHVSIVLYCTNIHGVLEYFITTVHACSALQCIVFYPECSFSVVFCLEVCECPDTTEGHLGREGESREEI